MSTRSPESGGARLEERPGRRRPPARLHPEHQRLAPPFGHDAFGRGAEAFARFFGTPGFLIGQTLLVAVWIAVNAAAVALRWDPYPFILLNLAFSTQAAYAAPLILLAQTRQADRDRARAEADALHREAAEEADLERQRLIGGELDQLRRRVDAVDAMLRVAEPRAERLEALVREIRERVGPGGA